MTLCEIRFNHCEVTLHKVTFNPCNVTSCELISHQCDYSLLDILSFLSFPMFNLTSCKHFFLEFLVKNNSQKMYRKIGFRPIM